MNAVLFTVSQLTSPTLTNSHNGALAPTFTFATPPRCHWGIGDDLRYPLGDRNSNRRDRWQGIRFPWRRKGCTVFVLRAMFWERKRPLFGPSSDLEESFKVSGFEQLLCFRAGAFGWRSRAFSKQEAWGGRGWSVMLREPSALPSSACFIRTDRNITVGRKPLRRLLDGPKSQIPNSRDSGICEFGTAAFLMDP